MILIALLISLVILGFVVFYITRPLVSNDDELINNSDIDRSLLNTEYQTTLNRIRELEQEHQDGKISLEDYQIRRDSLYNEASNFLKQLQSKE